MNRTDENRLMHRTLEFTMVAEPQLSFAGLSAFLIAPNSLCCDSIG